MTITEIQKPEIISFILENESADVNELLLKRKAIRGVPFPIIADQITGRKKAKSKLPFLYNNPNIFYPPGVNLEQSSSESTARFKAEELKLVFANGQPKSGADLTGGFGIDSFFLRQLFSEFHYVESNAALLAIAQHNLSLLKSHNITYHASTAEDFLQVFSENLDFIYLDPSRRSSGNNKVVLLSDCEPNIVSLQPKIFEKANILLLKASPLLDLTFALEQLSNVKAIIVLSVDNECKEVLFLCDKNFVGEALIKAVNLKENGHRDIFEFHLSDEKKSTVEYGEPENFLYEANASILKAGAFKSVASRFRIKKLHASTHLYTSENLIQDFPGRIFRIISHVKPDAKHLKNFFPEGKANIVTRNYPLSVEQLRKKTKLKDGSNLFLIAFSGVEKKYLVAAERV